jgi:hypothetical protein
MPENTTIRDLKAKFQDGARAYLFVLDFNFPTALGVTPETAKFLVRATTIPAKTIDPIIVPFAGMEYKIGSTSTFADWTVTFMVDAAVGIRTTFHDWSRLVHDPVTNQSLPPAQYKRTITVHQLDAALEVVYSSTLTGCWPSVVGEIALAQDTKEVETFDITFAYDYHEEVATNRSI